MVLDEMGNAMRDDARLAAPRTRKQQEGAFDMLNGLFLLGIEALQEVH